MRVAVYTLGCKLNQCESEAIADAFRNTGCEIVHPGEAHIDLYVVNTCTVTSKAEQKARRMIRKFAVADDPDSLSNDFSTSSEVIVTGCYAQMEADAITALDDHVTVVSLDRKSGLLSLPEHLSARLASGLSLRDAIRDFVSSSLPEGVQQVSLQDRFAYSARTFTSHARAFLKIEDGCDNSCAYCRVTLARGPAVSLDCEEAVRRARSLEADGFFEIVLTGVNITAYQSQGKGLGALLQTLLDETTEIRFRLSSLEPDMVDGSLLTAIADPRVRPHFHIPVQTGSDALLVSVRRHYTSHDVVRLVRELRSIKDDPFIAADIITGLPTETDDDADLTMSLIEDCGFSQVHVFPFSPRPGTELYTASGRVTESLRDSRAERLRLLSRELHEAYVARWIGRSVEAIIEHVSSQGATALTENYLSIRVTGIPKHDVKSSELRGRACIIQLHEESGLGAGMHTTAKVSRLTGKFVSWIGNIA